MISTRQLCVYNSVARSERLAMGSVPGNEAADWQCSCTRKHYCTIESIRGHLSLHLCCHLFKPVTR